MARWCLSTVFVQGAIARHHIVVQDRAVGSARVQDRAARHLLKWLIGWPHRPKGVRFRFREGEKMDPKDTWPVVKFLIAATGFKRRDARKMLEEIPPACHGDLFLRARRWERDTSARASEDLSVVLGGGSNLATLAEATRRAMVASHKQDTGDVLDDEGEEIEPRAPRNKRTRKSR